MSRTLFFLPMIINFLPLRLEALLSTATKGSSFNFFFFFFSIGQVVYRSVERVDGCQRRNDTAAFDAVDIVAAWLVLNGTLRVHVYEATARTAGAMDSLVEDISPD